MRAQCGGQQIDIPNILIDTGSASTLLAADSVAGIGLAPSPADELRTLRGIGGTEVVFARQLERLSIAGNGLEDFEIEVGGMDYGFEINGILGMDFLTQTAANLDLGKLEISFPAND